MNRAGKKVKRSLVFPLSASRVPEASRVKETHRCLSLVLCLLSDFEGLAYTNISYSARLMVSVGPVT
jgi:hypothetical protein